MNQWKAEEERIQIQNELSHNAMQARSFRNLLELLTRKYFRNVNQQTS